MNYFCLIFLLLSGSLYANQDPFYGAPAALETTNQSAQGEVPIAFECAAMREATPLQLAGDFSEFRFIGVVQLGEQWQALMLNHQAQIIALQPKQHLSAQGIQVLKISFKSITYIDWKRSPHCDKPYITTLTL